MLAGLAACAATPARETASLLTPVPLNSAFAFPAPGGPAITTVIERTYSNALEQDILLANAAHTSGQNLLRVQLFGTFDQGVIGTTALRDSNLSEGAIANEMRRLLPGVRMIRSSVFVQNKYGPFGFATGRTRAGDTCFYGWQKITAATSRETLLGNRGSVQIRLRLCDAAASEARLLDTMYGLTISASLRGSNWNPFGDAPPADPILGQSHNPIRPVIDAEVASAPPAAPAPRRQRTQNRRAAPAAAPPLAAPTGPTVPLPPPADTTLPAGQSAIVPPPP